MGILSVCWLIPTSTLGVQGILDVDESSVWEFGSGSARQGGWEQRGTSLVKKQAGEVVYARLQMEKLRQRETVWEDPTDAEQ